MLVIAFLSRCKHHGCSHHLQWFWSPKMWSLTVSIVSPSICLEVMRPNAMMLVFWMLSFKPTFSLSSFTVKKFTKKKKISPWETCKWALEREIQEVLVVSFLPDWCLHFIWKEAHLSYIKQVTAINIKFHFISLNFIYKLICSFLKAWLKYSKS